MSNWTWEESRDEDGETIDRARMVCAWCQSPIFEEFFYDIDGDAVCEECIGECRYPCACKE